MSGDGSISERLNPKTGKSYSPKRWLVTLSCGADPVTGERKRVVRTVRGTKAEARAARDKIRRELEGGLSVDDGDATFGEFAAMWYENRENTGELAQNTLCRYRSQIKLLDRYIRDVRLRDLDVKTIETLYSTIKRDKTEERGGYSNTTLRHIHIMLHQILAKAVDYDLILRNPCDRVDAPKVEAVKRQPLTQEEAAQLLSFIEQTETETLAAIEDKEHRQTDAGNLFGRSELHGLETLSFIQAVRIALATGARRGEILGLVWGCIDLDGKRLTIRQTCARYTELKEPKTTAGNRRLAIDEATVEHLRAWKEQQATFLARLGIKQDDGTPVCCAATGGFIFPDNCSRWWRKFREAAGFPDLKFHELRHTQATLLLANGVDIKTVQTRLGHASASITLNYYAHAIPENDENAADLVGELLAQRPQEAEVVDLKTA